MCDFPFQWKIIYIAVWLPCPHTIQWVYFICDVWNK